MAGGQFEVGHPKLPGAGRKPGTPNRSTLLKREAAVSAIETFRTMEISLPELGAQVVKVMNTIILAEIPEQKVALIQAMSKSDRDRLMKFCKMTADAIQAFMAFGYPKLASLQLTGETPQTDAVENKMVFELHMPELPNHRGGRSNGERHADTPGLPVRGDGGGPIIEHDDGMDRQPTDQPAADAAARSELERILDP